MFELNGIDVLAAPARAHLLRTQPFYNKPTSPSRAGNKSVGAPLGIHVQKYQFVEEDPLRKY